MSYSEHIAAVTTTLQNATVENLDLLTAFYLGMKAVSPDSPLVTALEVQVNSLFKKKRGLKFIDRFLVVSGSNNITPETKEKVLTGPNPMSLLSAINEIAGKTDATLKIKPYSSRIQDSTFHEEYLAYESNAFNAVVGALIKRLEPVVRKMAYGLPTVSPANKNTHKQLYHHNNVGKTFISIDLRQANWTALKYWDETLPTWEAFLDEHLPAGVTPNGVTPSDLKSLFATSKNFRQVTLGVALKKHGAVKMVEATQVMFIRTYAEHLVKKLGQPFSESNDEAIFEWRQKPGSPVEQLVLALITRPLFRITRFRIREKTRDECFLIDYEELGNNNTYTLLRCATPEKVESRLK